MLIWNDLETTGLDERIGSILEIALVATDDDLNTIGEPFVSLVRPLPNRGIEVMDDFVRKMHTDNGLLAELYEGSPSDRVLRPELQSPHVVCERAVEWVIECTRQHYGCDYTHALKLLKKTPLAGSTVHFDKLWLREHMLGFEVLLSHRTADVSSLNEWSRRWKNEVWMKRPGTDDMGEVIHKAHRAFDDIQASIDTAKHYRQQVWR